MENENKLFDSAYQLWIKEQVSLRSGENLRRLKNGHTHEGQLFCRQVWWPAIGHFTHLHTEYEVYDFQDGARYIDFAYIRPPYKIAIEIDGFKTHARDIDRWRFSDGLFRQNDLVQDDWKIYRFSYDAVKDKPKFCQQYIRQIIGRLYGGKNMAELSFPLKYREVIRLAARAGAYITPQQVSVALNCSDKHARLILRQMVDKDILQPASGNHRIRSYRLKPSFQSDSIM